MPWDPTQYLKFAGHRLRPAVDLLAHLDVDTPARGLRSGGRHGERLAVQMPRNFTAPSHTAIAEAARSAEPAAYFDLLAPRAGALDIWETEYLQVLEGEDAVKEWTKATWLRPLLDALDEPHRSGFEERYAELVARAYPRRPDGRTLLPFRRLFIVARGRRGSPD